jgi:phosphoglycolate phosphatase
MNTAKRAAQLLSTQNIRSLFESVEAFLFDCDGKQSPFFSSI